MKELSYVFFFIVAICIAGANIKKHILEPMTEQKEGEEEIQKMSPIFLLILLCIVGIIGGGLLTAFLN